MTHALVVRLDSIGDVLLQGPAVRAVAAGSDRVTMLCSRRGAPAAALLPHVDEVLVHDCPWIDPDGIAVTQAAMQALVDDVARAAPDLAIVLTSFHQSPLPTALLLRLAGVRRIGAISDDYPGSLLDVRHRVPDDFHEVERALDLVAALGFTLAPDDDGRLEIIRPRRRERVPVPFARYVVVHPGASVPARAWPVERHAALARLLVEQGRDVVVTGGPAERALTARVAGAAHDVLDLGGRLDLAGLAEVIARADATVVANTGPAHLAAAVGTPVISLFAPTVPPERWRPWRVPHVLVSLPVPCAGCRARACPLPGHPCMSQIRPDAVLAALDRLAPHHRPRPLEEVPDESRDGIGAREPARSAGRG